MKIYTIFTDSHKDLLYQYFLPSIYNHEYIEVVIKKINQNCPTAIYGSSGWFQTMMQKADYCRQACLENYGKNFIYADCDVQFLNPFVKALETELGEYDIALQDDVFPFGNRRTYCAGFFICKANEQTLQLFDKILYDMKTFGPSQHWDDQGALNNNIDITKHKPLSHRFYTIAQSSNKLWDNNYDISIPDNILVHHANWTHGVPNKIKLLEFVRKGTKK